MICYAVVILQKQIHLFIDAGNIVNPAGYDRAELHKRNIRNQIDGRIADARDAAPQRVRDIKQETRRLVVLIVKSQPSDQSAASLKLLGEGDGKSSLAEARPSLNESDLFRLRIPD